MQYHLLTPRHTQTHSGLTYVDEVVLLCLLKNVDVLFSMKTGEYTIDEEIVSTSIDKLIEKGLVDSDTLVPNKRELRKIYIKHLFVSNDLFEATNAFMYYDIIDQLEILRARWKSYNVIQTLLLGQGSLESSTTRISFTTLVNISLHKPKKYVPKIVPLVFNHNLELLESITSVLLKSIQMCLYTTDELPF
jgi:hypothetical protein